MTDFKTSADILAEREAHNGATPRTVSGVVLDNHRMVDTANERLGLILVTLAVLIDDSASDASNMLAPMRQDPIPKGIIPSLDDMLDYQSVNNDIIERILALVESRL